MKKLFALMLALVMMMTAASALAVTATVGFKADFDVAQRVMPTMNIPAEQVAQFQPIFALLNKLNIKVITAGNAAQLDLNVGETTALSAGGKGEGDVILIGASLIPNYLFKITEEDMKNIMAQIPGVGGGQGGSFNPEAFAAIAQKIGGYVSQVFPTIMGAMQQGEPETGSWEFEGYTFDSKTPITVDTKAIGEAVTALVNNLANDEEIAGLASSFGGDLKQIAANVSEAMSEEHMPDVAVEGYTSTANPAVSYSKSEATYKGASEPSFLFRMLQKEDGSAKMEFVMAEQQMTFTLTAAGNQFLLEMNGAEEGQFAAIGVTLISETAGQLDLFFVEKTPLLTITFDVDMADGEITLDLNEEGKTVLGLADLQGENAEQYTQGLQQDLMTNMMQLMAIPELAQLIAMFTSGMSMGN